MTANGTLPAVRRVRAALQIDPVEIVQPAGRMTGTGQEHRRLAAMLGSVIDLVEHLLPERVAPALTLQVLVLERRGETGFAQARDECGGRALDLAPAGADG